MKLTMLGTGHATVTKCYNTCFVLSEQDRHFLVDAGGGNQILRILEEEAIPLSYGPCPGRGMDDPDGGAEDQSGKI